MIVRRVYVTVSGVEDLAACRILACDYERDSAYSEAIIRWAAINDMLRRLTRGPVPPPVRPAAPFDWPS